MKSYKEIEKQARFYTDHRTKCKCGHAVLISSRDGKALCKWCRNYVFANKEIELKYRNKEQIERLKREYE